MENGLVAYNEGSIFMLICQGVIAIPPTRW